MNRIDRYISKLFVGYFLGGLLIFATIFLAIDVLSSIVRYQAVPAEVLIRYYMYYLPEVVYRMVPVACVLGTVFTLATLNKSNELVALYAAGMSLLRISTPVLFWVAILSATNFALSDRILPNFAKSKNYVYYHELEKKPSLYSMVKTNRIWYRSKDAIFNIKTLNEKAQRAQGLTLYYFNDKWDLIQMITAKEVELLGSNWNLLDGSVTVFTEDSSFPLTSNFKKKTIVMGEDAQGLANTGHTSDVLTMEELQEFIHKNKEAGLDTVRYEVDYHSKFGFALSGLVMVLLGIPFSVSRARSGGVMLNAGIVLGLVFLYYIFFSSALALGNYGQVPAIIAGWAPNLIVSAFALLAIRRMKV